MLGRHRTNPSANSHHKVWVLLNRLPAERTLICCFDHTFRLCFYDSMLPVRDEVEGCYYALGINSGLGEKRNTHRDARRVHSSC